MNNSLESRESASTFKAMHVVRKMKLEKSRKSFQILTDAFSNQHGYSYTYSTYIVHI